MMDDDRPFDSLSGSFIDEDGALNRFRSLSTPEDFIREALCNEDKANKYIKMADKRMTKFGQDDAQAKELQWAAGMLRDSAAGHREMAKILREQKNQ